MSFYNHSSNAHPDRTPVAVILAAGNGTRLRSDRHSDPKPLVHLRGLSLAERSVAQLMAAGIERFVIALGYEAPRIRSHFEEIATRRRCQIECVIAQDWQQGNGCSAGVAAFLTGEEPFLLTMVDHLLSPAMIQCILACRPAPGELAVAVDRTTTSLFDPDDLTKVAVVDGRITAIGKDLEHWNAGDTGLFYCTSGLLEGLDAARRHRQWTLTAGIRECATAGRVLAVDITGEAWLDIDTPAAHREAARRLDTGLSKEDEDGFISRTFNRPISRRISRRLADTAITPNQISVMSFFLILLGALLLATGGRWGWFIAGLIIQFASILDGCDGEIARLKFLGSSRGGWLDTILDRYGDLALGFAITFAATQVYSGQWIWPAGLLATLSFMLASYVSKEFELRFSRSYPVDFVKRLQRRDLRLLVLASGALLGYPFVALLGIGLLTHIGVLLSMVAAWRVTAPGAPSSVHLIEPEMKGSIQS